MSAGRWMATASGLLAAMMFGLFVGLIIGSNGDSARGAGFPAVLSFAWLMGSLYVAGAPDPSPATPTEEPDNG